MLARAQIPCLPIYSSAGEAYLFKNMGWKETSQLAVRLGADFAASDRLASVTHEAVARLLVEGIQYDHEGGLSWDSKLKPDRTIGLATALEYGNLAIVTEMIHGERRNLVRPVVLARFVHEPGTVSARNRNLILAINALDDIGINPEFLYRAGDEFGEPYTGVVPVIENAQKRSSMATSFL